MELTEKSRYVRFTKQQDQAIEYLASRRFTSFSQVVRKLVHDSLMLTEDLPEIQRQRLAASFSNNGNQDG